MRKAIKEKLHPFTSEDWWSGNKAMVNQGSTGEVVSAFSHQAAARVDTVLGVHGREREGTCGQEDNCMKDAWLFVYH